MLVGGTTDLRVVMTSEQHCADFEKFAVVIKVQGFIVVTSHCMLMLMLQ